MLNTFKVNSKDNKMKTGATIVNFEHYLHFILLLISKFEQINVGWTWETVILGNTFVSSNCGKCIVLGWENLLGYAF